VHFPGIGFDSGRVCSLLAEFLLRMEKEMEKDRDAS
jgi:hypothetical protein